MNLNGDKLESTSVAEDGTKICRSYDFNDTHCIIVSIIILHCCKSRMMHFYQDCTRIFMLITNTISVMILYATIIY